MSNILVQFTDSTQATVAAVYPMGNADSEGNELFESIATTDARYSAWYENVPALMQKYVPAVGS